MLLHTLLPALQDDAVAARAQALLSTPRLRAYRTTDVAGVELCGALKNVLAIAWWVLSPERSLYKEACMGGCNVLYLEHCIRHNIRHFVG